MTAEEAEATDKADAEYEAQHPEQGP